MAAEEGGHSWWHNCHIAWNMGYTQEKGATFSLLKLPHYASEHTGYSVYYIECSVQMCRIRDTGMVIVNLKTEGEKTPCSSSCFLPLCDLGAVRLVRTDWKPVEMECRQCKHQL